jgi:hypothetical protein
LNDGEVLEAKERRLKEIKMWEIMREIIAYGIFLWVLLTISLSSLSSNYYWYQKNIQKLFVSSNQVQEFDGVSIMFISKIILLCEILRL